MQSRLQRSPRPAPSLHAHAPRPWFLLVRQWGDFLRARHLSEATQRCYRYHLLRFFADVLIDPDELTEDDVTAYLASRDGRGQSIQQVLRALKSYYGWAVRRGFHEQNPAEAIRYRQSRTSIAWPLTDEEFRRVVIAAAWRSARRAWAIILTLETGARIGSMVGLEAEDVPTEPGRLIYFRRTKGNRPYGVPLSPLAAVAARELLASRNGHRTLLGVAANTLWTWYRQAALDAALPRRKSKPHALRQTFGTVMLERTRNPRLVADLLNHADLSQLHRYTVATDRSKRGALAEPVLGMAPD